MHLFNHQCTRPGATQRRFRGLAAALAVLAGCARLVDGTCAATADAPEAGKPAPAVSTYSVEIGGGYTSQAGTLPGGPPSPVEHVAVDFARAAQLGDVQAALGLRGALDYASEAPSRSDGQGTAILEFRRGLPDGVEASATLSYTAIRQLDLREREAKAVERLTKRVSTDWLGFVTLQERYLDFDGYSIKGLRADENDRDRVVLSAEAGFEHALGPDWTLRLSAVGEIGSYVQPVDDYGYRRDYLSATPLAGLVYARDGVSWAVQVGYMARSFQDDAFKPLSGIVGSGKMAWQATDRLKLVLAAETAFDDPEFFESRAARTVQVSAALGYRIGQDDAVELSGLWRRQDYTDVDRRDAQWLVAGEWTHKLAEGLGLVTRVSYGRRDLPFFGLGYDQTIARVSLRYQG